MFKKKSFPQDVDNFSFLWKCLQHIEKLFSLCYSIHTSKSDMFIQTIMSPAFLNASEYHGISAKDFLLMKIK